MAALRASMELFDKAGMKALTEKSLLLTQYLLFVLNDVCNRNNKQSLIEVITPFVEQQKGCQLSVMIKENGRAIFDQLTSDGVISDWREPDQEGRISGVIRLAPVPLYNSFEDVYRFGVLFEKAINTN
jgi:kynureninase